MKPPRPLPPVTHPRQREGRSPAAPAKRKRKRTTAPHRTEQGGS